MLLLLCETRLLSCALLLYRTIERCCIPLIKFDGNADTFRVVSSLSNPGWLYPPASVCPWVVRVTIVEDKACCSSSYISVVFLFSSRYFYCCPCVFLTGMSLHGVPVCLLLFRGGDGGGGASAAVARTRCPQEAKRALMSWDAGDFQPVLGEREMGIFEIETVQLQGTRRRVRSRAKSACHTARGKRGL